jgi:Capsid protein (F protein)
MKRSKFGLSYTHLTSMNMGLLVPVGCMEVLPGDTIQHVTSALVRTMPLVSPVMHPVDVDIHHWFVPTRIIWSNFEKFITGGEDGLDASVYPTINVGAGGAPVGGLADHLGVPTGVNNLVVSALPFRAYSLIYNEWYRDQQLQTPLALSKADGLDATTSQALVLGTWEKDYFTIARPSPQLGTSVTIPLVGNAPILTNPSALVSGVRSGLLATHTDGTAIVGNFNVGTGAGGIISESTTGAGVLAKQIYPSNLFADLASVSGVTISALRNALALQRVKEARDMYGGRYDEYLAYLGVQTQDGRLQRPEWCGGGRQSIQFSEIMQTAPAGATTAQNAVGAMKGHGIAAMRSNRYRKYVPEHGTILTFMIVRPKAIYTQGVERMWNRRAKEDFWQPELEHIGMQGILNKELFAGGASPDGIFGYSDRYDEYRRNWSKITGQFRQSQLNFWHFGRSFGAAPVLNPSFINCVPPTLPFAVTDGSQDQLYVMAKHSIQARRLVSSSSQPFIR